MPSEGTTTSSSSQEVTVNGQVDVRPVGKPGDADGTYPIVFYDADGQVMGYAQIEADYVSEVTDMVQSQVSNPSASLAISQAKEANQIELLSASSVVICVMLFAIFSAVCVMTLVRSLRLK